MKEWRVVKPLLFIALLALSSVAYAGPSVDDDDSGRELSNTLIDMDRDGDMQCLWAGIRDFYHHQISAVNLLEECGISSDRKIFAVIRTMLGNRDTDWRDWHCGPFGWHQVKCAYHGIEVVF